MNGYYRVACRYLFNYSILAWSKCFRSSIFSRSLTLWIWDFDRCWSRIWLTLTNEYAFFPQSLLQEDGLSTKKKQTHLYYFNKKVGRYTAVGQIFPLFSFSHSLVIVYFFFFALRYFVNYAPLLEAVCKFGYIVYCLATFFLPEIFSCLSVKQCSWQ